ncbi:MAG: hypothetical protein AABX38_06575 [Candidatus Micrarchaeota archaeon]
MKHGVLALMVFGLVITSLFVVLVAHGDITLDQIYADSNDSINLSNQTSMQLEISYCFSNIDCHNGQLCNFTTGVCG